MPCRSHPESPVSSPHLDVAALLSSERPAFLRFLTRRLRDDDLVEDIFQDALLKAMENANALRDEGALLGWFYRILRNAVVDHFRRGTRRHQALALLVHDLEALASEEVTDESPCHCVGPLTETLKPEYEEALRRIDMQGATVKGYAAEAGITANNAGVRVHRARRALHSQVTKTCGACAAAGCRDCTCERP